MTVTIFMKLGAIFKQSPWLLQSDDAVHMPISGLPKGHQITWKDLGRAFAAEQLARNGADGAAATEKKP